MYDGCAVLPFCQQRIVVLVTVPVEWSHLFVRAELDLGGPVFFREIAEWNVHGHHMRRGGVVVHRFGKQRLGVCMEVLHLVAFEHLIGLHAVGTVEVPVDAVPQ